MVERPSAAGAAADPRTAAGEHAAPAADRPAGDQPGPQARAASQAEPRSTSQAASQAAALKEKGSLFGPLFGPLIGIAQQLVDDLRGALQARAHLFALEAQRAGMALVVMIVFGMVAALLLVTAWFCLWALLIWVAVALGAPLWLALLAALALSLGASWLLLRLVRAEARHLMFPATVRQLGRNETPGPAAPSAAAGAAE